MQTLKRLLSLVFKKKYNDFFILESNCTLSYGVQEIRSMAVIVTSLIKKKKTKDFGCNTPFWRC